MSREIEPVHLSQDTEMGDYFLVYSTEKGLRLDLRYHGETLWMTQAQIAELFGVDRTTITKHIANVLTEGELEEEVVCAQFAHTTLHGAIQGKTQTKMVNYYNLDMIISVGYRVSSAQATLFRRWATGILVQYAKNGFAVDAPRLKQAENFDRIKELREIIRDIRADEANLYREVQRICAMCQDYDAAKPRARQFYRHMQAKLVYAVVSHTPAEITHRRADSKAANMGLQSWAGENICKSDVTVSKNYLAEAEIKELNRLTAILLDIFEDQLDIGRLVIMQDAADLLDKQLQNLGRVILRGGGSVSADAARKKAHAEYAGFDEQRKLARYQHADTLIAKLAEEAKGLPHRRQRLQAETEDRKRKK